jgi:DNA-binding transcriptional MerR regulator
VEKAPDAFRTISEVADDLDVPQHVLRFWESRFREIKPMKRGGGRRYYRPDDIDLLRGIRHLLYGEGYTIRGVQRILKEQGVKTVQSLWQPGAPQLKRRAGAADDVDAADDDVELAAADDEQSPRPAGTAARAGGATRPQQSASPQPAPRPDPSPPRAVPPAAAAGLGEADLRKLREALKELTECRSQLESAIGEVSISGETGPS